MSEMPRWENLLKSITEKNDESKPDKDEEQDRKKGKEYAQLNVIKNDLDFNYFEGG